MMFCIKDKRHNEAKIRTEKENAHGYHVTDEVDADNGDLASEVFGGAGG
jgi:hypothetical protein